MVDEKPKRKRTRGRGKKKKAAAAAATAATAPVSAKSSEHPAIASAEEPEVERVIRNAEGKLITIYKTPAAPAASTAAHSRENRSSNITAAAPAKATMSDAEKKAAANKKKRGRRGGQKTQEQRERAIEAGRTAHKPQWKQQRDHQAGFVSTRPPPGLSLQHAADY